MIRTSGGPLPTTRYPTAPSLVCAVRTGAETTEAAQLGGSAAGRGCGDEPHAPTAAATHATASPTVSPPLSVRWFTLALPFACTPKTAWPLHALDDGGGGHRAARAHGDQRGGRVAPLEFVQRGGEQPGPGAAHRVAEGDRPA